MKKHNGYDKEEKEDFIHRKRAYHIYLQNRSKYPLPWGAYEVHHKDFDKTNNKVENLEILTPTEHDKVHEKHDKEIKRKEEEKEKKEKEKQDGKREELRKEISIRFRHKNTKEFIIKKMKELSPKEFDMLYEIFLFYKNYGGIPSFLIEGLVGNSKELKDNYERIMEGNKRRK